MDSAQVHDVFEVPAYQYIDSGDAGDGDVLRMIGAPIHLSEAPFELRHTPPHLGEHSEAILGELGYDAAGIEKLREAGVLS